MLSSFFRKPLGSDLTRSKADMSSRSSNGFAQNPHSSKALILFTVFSFAIIFYFLAPFYGVLPLSDIHSLGILYTALGKIECLSSMGMGIECTHAGYPEGSTIPFGLPFAFLSALIGHLTGISALNAYNISGLLFMALGWAGLFLIIRSFGGNLFFSIAGSLLFFLMPIVWGKSSYGFLMWGFVISPFFIWLDLWYFRTKQYYLGVPVMLCSKSILLFMEPYTFVITFLFAAALMIYEFATAIFSRKLNRILYVKAAVVLVSVVLAYSLYTAYIPGGASYDTMSLNFFRGQGIDLVAFLYRGPHIYEFPAIWNFSIPDSRLFYTDGESLRHVYIGIVLAAVIPMAILFRTSLRKRNLLLLGVGIVSFILSLGPSLKINDRRNPDELTNSNITMNDYMMPEDAATFTMPHDFIYTLSPLKYMRSVSRWHLLTMISLVVTLMALNSILWGRGYRGKLIASLILSLVFIEHMPQTKDRTALIKSYTRGFNRFNETALAEFRSIASSDDVVLFLRPNGIGNEYLSTYLCSFAQCRSYNVSGDKSLEIARRQWPKLVFNTVRKPDIAKIGELLESESVSLVVFPHFDMRWNSYSWPPDQQTKESLSKSIEEYWNKDENLEYKKYEWYSTFRLKNKSTRELDQEL